MWVLWHIWSYLEALDAQECGWQEMHDKLRLQTIAKFPQTLVVGLELEGTWVWVQCQPNVPNGQADTSSKQCACWRHRLHLSDGALLYSTTLIQSLHALHTVFLRATFLCGAAEHLLLVNPVHPAYILSLLSDHDLSQGHAYASRDSLCTVSEQRRNLS